MRLFLDTSAFVKRYVAEAGSDEVLARCEGADELGLSVICLPEVVSTLRRLVREGRLAEEGYQVIKGRMLEELADVDLCDITPEVLGHAVRALERSSLRAMDSLHIGCALAYRPDLFVSADLRQLEAARAAGLPVQAA